MPRTIDSKLADSSNRSDSFNAAEANATNTNVDTNMWLKCSGATELAIIPMRAAARVIEETRNAPEPRGTSNEDLPMEAGIRTDSEIIIEAERKSPSTSLPSKEEAAIVKPRSAIVITKGATRLLNWAT